MVAPYSPISNVVPWTQAIAGLNQSIYGTNWTANDSTDILVYVRTSGTPASDALQLVPSTQYTVQFIGPDNIVQVTFGTPYIPLQYSIVTIMRATPSQFIYTYTNTNFTPSMLNSDFETLTQIDQQNQLYWQQIVPRYNNSATVNVPIDTILPVLGANQFWIKNSSNTAFIPATISGSGEFPALGPFVLYAEDSNYPEGFNLGSLNSGLLAQNTSFGISTPYSIPFPITVSLGGTGLTSIVPYATLIGGTTPTSPIVPVVDLGDVGDVWTSSGAGAAPSFQPLNPVTLTKPTFTRYLSGSGTYTPPANCLFINVTMIGAGGGGGCVGAVTSSGVNGTNTTFGTALLVTAGGSAGGNAASPLGGPGGGVSQGSISTGIALVGGAGSPGTPVAASLNGFLGGMGGSNAFGGAGTGAIFSFNGNNAAAYTGAGGGGGAGTTISGSAGGGGAGGYLTVQITSLAASYAYSVGAGGAGAVGAVSNGGNGANGFIIISEYYQ